MPELSDIIRMFAPNTGVDFYSYDFNKLVNGKSEYVLVASPSSKNKIDTELMDMLLNFGGCEFTTKDILIL